MYPVWIPHPPFVISPVELKGAVDVAYSHNRKGKRVWNPSHYFAGNKLAPFAVQNTSRLMPRWHKTSMFQKNATYLTVGFVLLLLEITNSGLGAAQTLSLQLWSICGVHLWLQHNDFFWCVCKRKILPSSTSTRGLMHKCVLASEMYFHEESFLLWMIFLSHFTFSLWK